MITLERLQNPSVRPAALILLFALLLVIFPNFSHLPTWLCFVMTALILWRGCHELQLCAIPSKTTLFILTLMLLFGITYSYHTIIGRNAGSAMLLGLLCLKLFEIKSFRDVSIIINLALFSIVINFLFNQSIFIAFTMLIALVFLFSALVGFQHDYKELHQTRPLSLSLIRTYEKQHFKLAFIMLFQAVPLAVVLFILFPRVDAPLWGLPEDAFSGITGLSDNMSPGKLSQLSNNPSVAFRVKFDSVIPDADKLYWRGPVMWHFDGYSWTAPENERIALNTFKFTSLGKIINYSITLQPHNDYWLLALDIPAALPANSQLSTDMQVLSVLPVQKLKRYDLRSYVDYILPASPSTSMKRYLKLPPFSSNKVDDNLYKSRQLINKLKDTANPTNTVNNVLNYFATQNFYYSRRPPLLQKNPVDQFLFETKRGYCEHYASGFTVLMRLAGIPARVVTGYQGGELNPIDNYMTIRQSDAHAWSEVFLNEKGWVRIDPTASIPPANIENTDDALRLNSNSKKPAHLFQSSWLSKRMKQARFAWDAVNNRWNQWVLGYNHKKQKALFAAIGIPEISWKGLSQLLSIILIVLTALLSFYIFSNKTKNRTEIEKYYFSFLAKMKKHHLIKKPFEGANDFSKRAILKLPQSKNDIKTITLLYQQLRYKNFSVKGLVCFKNKIKNFKINTTV